MPWCVLGRVHCVWKAADDRPAAQRKQELCTAASGGFPACGLSAYCDGRLHAVCCCPGGHVRACLCASPPLVVSAANLDARDQQVPDLRKHVRSSRRLTKTSGLERLTISARTRTRSKRSLHQSLDCSPRVRSSKVSYALSIHLPAHACLSHTRQGKGKRVGTVALDPYLQTKRQHVDCFRMAVHPARAGSATTSLRRGSIARMPSAYIAHESGGRISLGDQS